MIQTLHKKVGKLLTSQGLVETSKQMPFFNHLIFVYLCSFALFFN